MPKTLPIPTSSDELEAMIADDKVRAEIFADPDATREFLANYTKAMNKGGDLAAQLNESLQAGLADMLRDNGIGVRAPRTTVDGVPLPSPGNGAVRNAAHNPALLTASLDGLYSGLGAMAIDVQKHRQGHEVANAEAFAKVQEITNAYSSQDPSTGGFLVPEETRAEIMRLVLEQSIVRPRATVITMGTATTSIPYVEQTTNVGSVFGGMVFYWIGESETITPTEAKFGRVKLEANKLVGGARIPNELWRDAPALTTFLESAAPSGLSFFEDTAFFTGNGVDRPLGVLNSPALITVTRAANDELAPIDIYTMWSRMLPQSHGTAVWLVNQTLAPKLFGMQTVVENVAGTENVGGGFPLGVMNIAGQPFMSLLGRPLIFTEKVPALANGAGKDISYVDLAYYLIGDRQAVSLDYSEHSRFMNDETELRLISRVDGRPWVQSALTPLNGSTLSPYVTLGD